MALPLLPILRGTIVPTEGGWLAQVLDPRATVQLLKVYSSRSKAINAIYDFVEKAGY
jgi:hypothetical protein